MGKFKRLCIAIDRDEADCLLRRLNIDPKHGPIQITIKRKNIEGDRLAVCVKQQIILPITEKSP